MQTLAAETPAKRAFNICKSSKYFAAFGAYDRAGARSTGKKRIGLSRCNACRRPRRCR